MAEFTTDLEDIYFNLFNVLKVQNAMPDVDENSIRDIVSAFDDFVKKEVNPTRAKGDVEGVKLTENGVVVPACYKKALQQYYENGWYALGQEAEIGGMPSPYAVTIACSSILTGANVAFSMYPGLTLGAMNVIKTIGNDNQKSKYIAKMMSGEFGGTMCLTEPNAGSDVGNVVTTATPRGDGKYNIKGVKIFISSGDNDLYQNIIHLVLARLPGAPKGPKGLSLFIVPKFVVDDSGNSKEFNNVKCTKIEEKMGIHGSSTCELTFGIGGDCVGELIGKEHEGMANMFLMMNEARLLCGTQGQSQAALVFELTKQFAAERVQFGKVINQFPDVKKMLLNMRASARGMRALSLYVANLFDLEHKDPEVKKEIALLIPICKGYMTDEGCRVAITAMQVHGGYGYCTEYGIEQFVRDSKIASIYEGTNGIQAIDFVMRKIMGDQGKQFFKLGQKINETMRLPEAQEFKHELTMMGKSMERTEEILKKFAGMAAAGNMDGIQAYTTDFLLYCSHIVMSWRLLVHACEAVKMRQQVGTSHEFYTSKINDFKIYCQFRLVENIGLANSILNFDEDLIGLNI